MTPYLSVRSSTHLWRCTSPAAIITCSPVSCINTWTQGSAWFNNFKPSTKRDISPGKINPICNHKFKYFFKMSLFVWLGFNVVLKVISLIWRRASPMGEGNHPWHHWQQTKTRRGKYRTKTGCNTETTNRSASCSRATWSSLQPAAF